MPTIVEARSRVQREMRQLVALVDRESPQTATEVELALWSGGSQIGDPAYPSGTPPEQTEFLVPYCDVFPWDFDLTVAHSGRKYLATDTYCMNPSCRCDDVAVQFLPIGKSISFRKSRQAVGHVVMSARRQSRRNQVGWVV